jgi:hypothetical protein
MLCEAAVDGSLEKVKMLLAHGADGTQGTTLHNATLHYATENTAKLVLSHSVVRLLSCRLNVETSLER